MEKRSINGLIPARSLSQNTETVVTGEEWDHVLKVLDSQYDDLKAARHALCYAQDRRYELAKQVIVLTQELEKKELKEDYFFAMINKVQNLFK